MTGSLHIAILLATYNGEAYLNPQIESLAAQTVSHRLDVWVSDDGSTDATAATLAAWARGWPKGQFTVLNGPRDGFAQNFVSLLQNEAIEADYFAFCDQDDVWDADKLARAIAWFEEEPFRGPRAYGSRTRLVASDGRVLGQSPLFPHRPTFRNAIVQSIAGGNTIVIDRAARELLARSTCRTDIVSHDWWTYIMVTGAGGEFRYDPQPSISYRQHGGNAIGSNYGWCARMQRLRRMAGGVFREWNETNIVGLSANVHLLTNDAKVVLERFQLARTAPLPSRLDHLAQSGIFRQTKLDTVGLYAACALGHL